MFKGQPSDRLSLVLSTFWERLFPQVQDAYTIPKILERIEDWVGKEPTLTSVLCDYVLKYASQLDEANISSTVDKIVQDEILSDWKDSEAAPRLDKLEEIISSYEHRDVLMLLYMQILQRGSVPAKKSPEQAILLKSGLVTESNRKLIVANRLYSKIFDMDWVEQLLPGITRPVAIVEKDTNPNRQPSLTAGLYSKLAVGVCCLAVIGTAVSAYIKAANSQAALATQETPEVVNSAAPTDELSREQSIAQAADPTTSQPDTNPNASNNSSNSDRALYDKGIDHATNGRWLPMAREFCLLTESSAYFWTAEKQLEKWLELYPEDIAIAQDTFSQETGASCPILTIALEKTGIGDTTR